MPISTKWYRRGRYRNSRGMDEPTIVRRLLRQIERQRTRKTGRSIRVEYVSLFASPIPCSSSTAGDSELHCLLRPSNPAGAVPSLIVWVWVRSGKGVRDSKGQFCTRKCITDSVDLGTCAGSARITGQPDVGRPRARIHWCASGRAHPRMAPAARTSEMRL